MNSFQVNNILLPLTITMKAYKRQVSLTCSLKVLLTLVLIFNIVRVNNTHAHNQDTQSDNPVTTSQDTNQDSSDRSSSYDLSNTPESRDDEVSETNTLPAPNELSVIRLNETSVVLRWDFSEDSQEHLQYFKIQHRPAKRDSQWRTEHQEIAPSTRACQINGLRPGNFQFSVIAVYDNDDNISSEPLKYKIRAKSKIKTEEMPEMKAPEIYWSEVKSDYIRFKWKYEPKERDHDIFGFLVYYRSIHIVADFTIYNTVDSECEIAELEPDTPYEAKVVAYNTVGISEFSDTITIRTEAQSNSTVSVPTPTIQSQSTQDATSAPVASTTVTRKPLTVSWPPNGRDEAHTTAPAPVDPQAGTTQAPRPSIIIGPPSYSNNSTTIAASDFYKNITNAFNAMLGDQSDAMLIIRYLLLVMLPIIFIVSVLICLIRGPSPSRKQNESPSSTTTDDSMQFDLEINGYFKNSFPGVEKEYSSVASHNEVNHGFVNNHPHISEFA